ncbi:MAG: transketolase [Candidatus Margulisiibacteriota bacterium]|jgi:transketolase
MDQEIKKLKQIANKLRTNIIKMISCAESGHPGGSLSATDILTVLFFQKMKYDVKNPDWFDRDRFILSKGHCSPLLYSALAEAGFIKEEVLTKFRKINSCLQGHPARNYVPGIEMSTGSLGQGLSIANGVALGLRLDKSKGHVYVLLGDGELQEGMVWEAAMTAAHYEIDNLTAIVDQNGMQIDGLTKDVMNIEPLADKWKAFGWEVISIDGHNFKAISDALDKARTIKAKPTIILANTIKGKGVSFMEHSLKFHGSAPTLEQTELALRELEKNG